MKIFTKILTILWALLCMQPTQAQSGFCGTVFTPEEIQQIDKVSSTISKSGEPIRIPMAIHIYCAYETNDLANCIEDSYVDNLITKANQYFASADILLIEECERNYIENTAPIYWPSVSFGNAKELADLHDKTGVVNIYFVNNFLNPNNLGVTFPTENRIFIDGNSPISQNGNLAHEMGHCLGLKHTSGANDSIYTTDLVLDYLNSTDPNSTITPPPPCDKTGDKLCDTPPDAGAGLIIWNANKGYCDYVNPNVGECDATEGGRCDIASIAFLQDHMNNIMRKTLACKESDSPLIFNDNQFNHFTDEQITKMRNFYDEFKKQKFNKTDLYMKDTPNDPGREPNEVSGWVLESPDIINCQFNASCGINEDPIYNLQTNGNQTPNYLSVRIRNRGCFDSPSSTNGGPKLRVYWTRARSGEVFPNDWLHSEAYSNNYPELPPVDNTINGCIAGEEITVQDPSGTQPLHWASNPIFLPSIPAGGEVLISPIPWYPPNPDCFPFIDTNNQNYEFESQPMICYLARIVGAYDPMYNEPIPYPVTNLALDNNNIATRNATIVTLEGGEPEDGDDESPITTVLVNNPSNIPETTTIHINQIKPTNTIFTSIANLKVFLSGGLWDKWVAGGQQSTGMQVISHGQLLVTDIQNATLSNISLQANEGHDIGIQFVLPETSTIIADELFSFGLFHTTTNHSEYQGGGTFNVLLKAPNSSSKNSRKFLVENIGDISIVPNPVEKEASILLSVSKSTQIQIEIRDISGRLVKVIAESKNFEEGHYRLNFSTEGMNKGIYFCKLTSDEDVKTQKFLVIK